MHIIKPNEHLRTIASQYGCSMKEIMKKISYQENSNLIMDNLDEILISKSKKQFDYVNEKGYELI
jgi:hypothetical protein